MLLNKKLQQFLMFCELIFKLNCNILFSSHTLEHWNTQIFPVNDLLCHTLQYNTQLLHVFKPILYFPSLNLPILG